MKFRAGREKPNDRWDRRNERLRNRFTNRVGWSVSKDDARDAVRITEPDGKVTDLNVPTDHAILSQTGRATAYGRLYAVVWDENQSQLPNHLAEEPAYQSTGHSLERRDPLNRSARRRLERHKARVEREFGCDDLGRWLSSQRET